MSEIGKLWVNLELKNKEFMAAIDATNQRLDKLSSASSHLVVTFGDVMNYGGKLAGAIWSVAQSAGDAELQSKRLADAMKAQGIYTDEAHGANLAFAQSLQDVTKYNDESIKSVMQLLTTFGLHDTQLRKTTQLTADLASGLGIDLRTAAMLMGKAFAGETSTLSRYGMIIDESIPKGERFSAVMAQIQQKFGGAAAGEAQTFLGKVEQLKNAFDDLKESIGNKVLPALTDFVDLIKDGTVAVQESEVFIKAYGKALGQTSSQLSDATGFNAFKALMKSATETSVSLGKTAADYWAEAAKDIVVAASRAGDGAVDAGKKANGAIVAGATAKSAAEIELERKAAAEKIAINNKIVSAMEQNIRKEIQAGQEKNKKLSDLSDKLMKEVVADAKKQESEEVAAKQRTIASIQEMVTAYGTTLSNFSTYQNTLIQNDLQSDLEAEQQKYDTKKAWIEANITDEEKKSAMLRTLEQDHGDTQARLQKEAEKRQEEAHRKMKPLLIAEALANTAVGVTKAFSQGGVLGFITGGLVAAAGAAQVAIIDAQKFAEGGIVGGSSYTGDNVLAAVNSGEMILNQGQQARLFDAANGRGAGGQQTIVVNLDGKVLAKATAQNFPAILRLYGAAT